MKIMIILVLTITILSASCGILEKLQKNQLTALAIETEEVYRKENNVFLLGGLHDFAYSLSKERLIEEISNLITLGGDKLDSFVKNQVDKLTESTFKFPIKAILSKYTKEQLLRIASLIETHNRSEHIFTGGLHDYAESLTKEELVNAIIDFSTAWGNYRTKLVVLASSISDKLLVEASREVSIDILKKFSYALEKYNRKIYGNENLLGGVHDIIEISEDVKFIIDIINSQILSIMKLDKNFVYQRFTVELVEDLVNSTIMSQNELAEYLQTKSFEELKKLALKTESHYRKVQKLDLDGGLHDYIERLTSSDLIEYIQSKAKIVPLIATEKFLDM